MYLQVKRAAMALFLSLICFAAFAQKTVTGTVKDATGEPMIGVSVVVDGTSIGSVTDLDGNFTIQKVPENATLKISYVGYKEQKLQVAGKSSFQIVMDEETLLVLLPVSSRTTLPRWLLLMLCRLCRQRFLVLTSSLVTVRPVHP